MFDTYTTTQLIERGRDLVARIAADEAELKGIEAELRNRALAMPHEPLTQDNREGRRATLRGDGQQLTVLFESDILKASFASDSPVAKSILPLLDPDQTKALFKKKTTYERAVKDGHKFRLQCAEILPQELSVKVIDLLKDRDRNGIVKSKSVIEWKSAATSDA